AFLFSLPPTTQIYTPSLHDALPICDNKNIVTTASAMLFAEHVAKLWAGHIADAGKMAAPAVQGEPVGEVRLDLGAPSVIYAELRSEEHTSELQSRENLVCRLLLEKK